MKINSYYNLSTFATPILGSSYKGIKLIGLINYESAIKLDDIEGKQAQVFPYLPSGTPRDHRTYTYYHFKNEGKDLILADFWIIPGSMVETDGTTRTITLHNVSSEELTVIREQLRLLNIRFEII